MNSNREVVFGSQRTDDRSDHERATRTSTVPSSQQGLIVKMDEFEKALNKHDPIGDIAVIIGKLTYGEMVQLADELWKAVPETALTSESLPAALHAWQKGRGTKAVGRAI